MLIASLAISGVPLFSGFSKDEILLVAFHHNIPLWVVASSLL
jgi:NADH-quinone oxidoreductase subunit L